MYSTYTISAPFVFDGSQYHESPIIKIKDGKIVEYLDHMPPDIPHIQLTEGTLIPGFIDIQVNGGGGILFNNDPSLSALKTIIQSHLKLGTHAILPTLITSEHSTLTQALDTVENGIQQNLSGLIGIHIEGPMINPRRKGMHNDAWIRLLNDKTLALIETKSLGKIIITLAPECVPLSLIESLTSAGIIVFAGHSEASSKTLEQAIEKGLRGFTHVFNAMPPLLSRDPGIVGVALNSDSTWTSFINDDIHVDKATLKIALKVKEPSRRILITDAMATIGSDIDYFYYNQEKIILKNNKLQNNDGNLAGTHISLWKTILNTQYLGCSLEESIQMATINPANCLNISNDYGHLKVGAKACFNLIQNENLTPFIYKNYLAKTIL